MPTETVVDRFGLFYATVLAGRADDDHAGFRVGDRAAFLRRARGRWLLQRRSQNVVVLQRINLGLYAVLGSLNATANWRRIGRELWPACMGPASTPIGEAEARWEKQRAKREPISV